MATSLKLDDATKDRVQHLAALRDRSPHWIMREAIREYVEREEARESFAAEAMASWVDYQETGRHLTAAEAVAWLNNWGTDAESKRPECHD
jgi:predicted transcriptional regulator